MPTKTHFVRPFRKSEYELPCLGILGWIAVYTQSVKVIKQLINNDHVPLVLEDDCQPTVAISLPLSPSPEIDAAEAKYGQ